MGSVPARLANMAGYRVYPRADAAQDKIWRDTFDAWGEAQADTYIRELHAHLRRVCEDQSIWRWRIG
jgi:toxin ParE1/3/4